MIRRLLKDESGVTMGLAVIMIVLIGVMGAGLLTFVMRDLDSLVEVNRGQKAFEMADAGAQLAINQLRRDPLPTHYDLDDVVGSVASPVCDVPAAQAVVNGTNLEDQTLFPLLGGNWAPDPTNVTPGGIIKSDLDGGANTNDSVHVTIQWLNPAADPDVPAQALCAAPSSSPPQGSSYFRVVSTGTHSGAKRKVEAIYETHDLGIPKGYFARENISLGGSVKVQNISVFSLGDISVSNGAQLLGEDLAYGDWYDSRFNLVRRKTPLNVPVTAAGLGAKGTVSGAVATRDYGGLVHPQPSTPSSTQITFPFSPDAEPDLNVLRQEAIAQQGDDGQTHYFASNGGTVRIGSPGEFRWPDNSTYRTVVFVEYAADANNLVRWQEDGSCTIDPLTGLITGATKKGTLVVKGGDFTMQGDDAPLEGVVIVRGGSYQPGDYSGEGNSCLKGYANTSGTIDLRGNASPADLLATSMTPGFFSVRLWNWRELYG